MSNPHTAQKPGTIKMQGHVICGYCLFEESDDEGWQLGTFATKLELSGWYKEPKLGWICYNCRARGFGRE